MHMTFGFDFGLQILAEIPVSTWVHGLDGTLYSMMITDVINSLRFKGAVSRYSVIFCAFFARAKNGGCSRKCRGHQT